MKMENKIENIKNGEHKLIWQKIENLEKYLINDIKSQLIKLNDRIWRLLFAILAILASLSIALILALLKIMP